VIENKKNQNGVINTLQLAARKNLIQLSSDVINYKIVIVTVILDFQGTYQKLA
jgi:hypothetical protein